MSVKRRREEAVEDIKLVLADMAERIDSVLVEGARDAEALSRVGYSGKVEVLHHSGVSLVDVAVDLAGKYRRILVLTDFDEAGEEEGSRVAQILESHGATMEHEARRLLRNLFRLAGIRTIESLPSEDSA